MNKCMKLWEVSLWPNNQPPILLGEYRAKNKKEAIKMAAIANEIEVDDNFWSAPAGKNSPINKWRKH